MPLEWHAGAFLLDIAGSISKSVTAEDFKRHSKRPNSFTETEMLQCLQWLFVLIIDLGKSWVSKDNKNQF